MNASRPLTQRAFLLLPLIAVIAMAQSGCVLTDRSFDTPAEPISLEAGISNRDSVLETLGNPIEETADGRLALHEYTRTRNWYVFLVVSGSGIDRRNLLLVNYDQGDVVSHIKPYQCGVTRRESWDIEYSSEADYSLAQDPVCLSEHRMCGVLYHTENVDLLNRYCEASVIEYHERLARAQPLLHKAVENGDPEGVAEAIALGAIIDISTTGRRDLPPLITATVDGHTAIVELLLKNGANPDIPDPGDRTALSYAVREDKVDLVQILLSKGASTLPSDLATAVDNDNLSIARLLVAAGTTVNWAAMHYAAEIGRVEMAELLLEAGGNVDARDFRPRTPLHTAARYGQYAMAEYLLDSGATVNPRDQWGRTPLRFARKRNHGNIAALLVRYGGIECKDRYFGGSNCEAAAM